MVYDRPGWWRRLVSARDEARWRFEVDRSAAPGGVAWRWERIAGDHGAERSEGTFPSFLECARDARAHGFAGNTAYVLSDRPSVPASAWAGPARAPADARDIAP